MFGNNIYTLCSAFSVDSGQEHGVADRTAYFDGRSTFYRQRETDSRVPVVSNSTDVVLLP